MQHPSQMTFFFYLVFLPDCDEAQLDGVNGPLHSLLPADGGGEEEHKDVAFSRW